MSYFADALNKFLIWAAVFTVPVYVYELRQILPIKNEWRKD